MIDIWSSTGLCLPRQLDFVAEFYLPADETVFLLLRAGTRQLARQSESRGIWSEMVRLARIWARIHHLNKASVGGLLELGELEATVNELAYELRSWSSSLPSTLQESHENLERYTSLGLGNAFAALHLGYHYYNEVLFYQFLAKTEETDSSSTLLFRNQCEEHAMAFCNLLYLCRSMEHCQCLYIMVGHMLVVTSTVYIHVLLFSDHEAHIAMVRERLARNFEILTELQAFWVALDATLSRLKVFHNACRKSINQSFRMDKWMLKFILEHGNSVVERPFDDPSDSATFDSDLSASPDNLQEWYLQTF
jgi:hypothetical protein